MKLNKKTIYRVKTQEAYDALMKDAEEQGYRWFSGNKPTELAYWRLDKENTAVYINEDGTLTRGEFDEKDVTKPRYKEWSVIDYDVVPKIYPINFGCVGIDAPDFETARRMVIDYMSKLDTSLYGIVNPKVYTIRVEDNKTTVITPDGKCATAKCHPDDEFDIIEGFKTAIEKIREMDRKLTFEEKRILSALELLNCDTFEITDYDQINGYNNNGNDVEIDITDKDVFSWLNTYKEFNVKEILDKYA